MNDDELTARAAALQREGLALIDALDLPAAFPEFGPVQAIGSVVSGLMAWPDLDLMFTAPVATGESVVAGIRRLVTRPGFVAFDYRDERAERRPSPQLRDERYYVVCRYEKAPRTWKIDITIWLHR